MAAPPKHCIFSHCELTPVGVRGCFDAADGPAAAADALQLALASRCVVHPQRYVCVPAVLHMAHANLRVCGQLACRGDRRGGGSQQRGWSRSISGGLLQRDALLCTLHAIVGNERQVLDERAACFGSKYCTGKEDACSLLSCSGFVL